MLTVNPAWQQRRHGIPAGATAVAMKLYRYSFVATDAALQGSIRAVVEPGLLG